MSIQNDCGCSNGAQKQKVKLAHNRTIARRNRRKMTARTTFPVNFIDRCAPLHSETHLNGHDMRAGNPMAMRGSQSIGNTKELSFRNRKRALYSLCRRGHVVNGISSWQATYQHAPCSLTFL